MDSTDSTNRIRSLLTGDAGNVGFPRLPALGVEHRIKASDFDAIAPEALRDIAPLMDKIISQFAEGAVRARERLHLKMIAEGTPLAAICERIEMRGTQLHYECWPVALDHERTRCRRCGGQMRPGKAIGQTFTDGLPDFHGDQHAVTLSAGGPGRLIDCMKCSTCGHSVT